MAKGKKGRLRKIASRCVRGLLVVLALAFVIFWLWGPSVLRNWLIGAMADEGIEANLTVDDLWLSNLTISKLSLQGRGVDLNVSEIRADYGVGSLIDGRIDAVAIEMVEFELDLDDIPTEKDESEKTLPLAEKVREWGQLAKEYTTPGFHAGLSDLNVTLSSEKEDGDEYYANDLHFTLAMLGEDGPVEMKLFPSFVNLADVSLQELEYVGKLASLSNPVLSSPQILRCKKLVMTGSDKMALPVLDDLEMNFRIDDQWNALLLGSLGFKFRLDKNASEFQILIRPQGAALTSVDAGGVNLELNATTIELPDDGLAIEGLAGMVRANSFDPLDIPKSQKLIFDKATFGDMTWGPGDISFSADGNGTFYLERFEGEFLGETLQVKPVKVDLSADALAVDFTLAVTGENNQSLAELSAQPSAVKEGDSNQSTQWKIPIQFEVSDLAHVSEMAGEWNRTVLPEGLEVVDGDLNSTFTVITKTDGFLAVDFNTTVNDLNVTLSSNAGDASEYYALDAKVTFARLELALPPSEGNSTGDFHATVNDLNIQPFAKEEDFNEYYAKDINATLAMSNEDGPVKIQILPCFVSLPGISLKSFSYEGVLSSFSNPVLSTRQTLRCKKFQWGDNLKMALPDLHDLKMNFRIDDQWNTLLLESLDFNLDDNASEARCRIQPQRAALNWTPGGEVTLELNATTIELPVYELAIEGLAGKVWVKSFDPLEIPQSQLTFDKVTFRGMAWGPGKILFSADRNGTFFLEKCQGEFLGGTLQVKPVKIDLSAAVPEYDFTFVVAGENNQSLVEFSVQPIAVTADDSNQSSGQQARLEFPLQGKVFDLAQVFRMVGEWNSAVLPEGLAVQHGSVKIEGDVGFDSNDTRLIVERLEVDLLFDFFGNSFNLQGFHATSPIHYSSAAVFPNQNVLVEFKSTKMADISWGPGELEIGRDENANLIPIRCKGEFLGGTLELKYDHDFNATDGILEVKASFDEVDSEELVKLMPGLGIVLRGRLSGEIKLSDREGFWNYLNGGYVEMVSDEGYLSYPSDGLFTEGVDPESSDFKWLRLAEQALQDLDLSKLRLDFRVDPEKGHSVKGDLHGTSEVGNKRIKVTYRPKSEVTFIELLQQVEFGGISFE